MSSSVQYSRSADASASAVGERVVLYHRVSRTAIVLNPTGGWMWQQLQQPRSAADLARGMQERYPSLMPDAAERDVAAFLAELVRLSMVSFDE